MFSLLEEHLVRLYPSLGPNSTCKASAEDFKPFGFLFKAFNNAMRTDAVVPNTSMAGCV